MCNRHEIPRFFATLISNCGSIKSNNTYSTCSLKLSLRWPSQFRYQVPSLKLTARTWNTGVGRWVSFWEGLLTGAMLVLGGYIFTTWNGRASFFMRILAKFFFEAGRQGGIPFLQSAILKGMNPYPTLGKRIENQHHLSKVLLILVLRF